MGPPATPSPGKAEHRQQPGHPVGWHKRGAAEHRKADDVDVGKFVRLQQKDGARDAEAVELSRHNSYERNKGQGVPRVDVPSLTLRKDPVPNLSAGSWLPTNGQGDEAPGGSLRNELLHGD